MQSRPSHATAADERQLIMASRLKAGDKSVLIEILAEFGPSVAHVLGQDYPPLAGYIEDILAEALRRLWDNRDVYNPKRTPLKRWFYIIAQHIALDQFKCNWQKTRQMEATSGGKEVVENVVGDDSEITDEIAYMPQDERDIKEIVARLSIIEQKIVVTHAYAEDGEFWAANLSEEIGMEPGAIRVRLGRIHAKIEKEMNRRGHNLKRAKRSAPRTIPIENISENMGGSL